MLFQEWEVPIEGKERKLKLVQKFWSAEIVRYVFIAVNLVLLICHGTNVRQPGGMERSANIVIQLLGETDLESSALDLIFRPPSSGQNLLSILKHCD